MEFKESIHILKQTDLCGLITHPIMVILRELGHKEECPFHPSLKTTTIFPLMCECGLFKKIEEEHDIDLKEHYVTSK